MFHRPIGIIDSGIGGLTIHQNIANQMPAESIIYIGDHQFLPYGNKNSDEIVERVYLIIDWLIRNECKMIVIACNTATVAGIEKYRMMFPDIPIIGVVPVIKTAAELEGITHYGMPIQEISKGERTPIRLWLTPSILDSPTASNPTRK